MERFEPNRERSKPVTIVDLEDTARLIESSNLTGETFLFFKEFLISHGLQEAQKFNQVVDELGSENLIVRREDPRQLLKLLSEEKGYSVSFEDSRYTNCVEWNPQIDGSRGISNAYLEGLSHLNHVVAVIGFVKESDMDIVTLPDAHDASRNLDRTRVRSFQGEINQNNVRFINLRIPGHLMPQTELTDSELDLVEDFIEKRENNVSANPVMIHRSYTIKKESPENIH